MTDTWTGKRVRLRAVASADWAGFRDLALGDVAMRNDVLGLPRSDERFESWTAERAGSTPGGEAFRLVVESLDDGSFAGTVTVGGADHRTGLFLLGVAIAAEHQRKGYASEAVELLLAYMFAEQRLHKCEVEVYAFNEASLRLFRGLGFTEEGRLREHAYLGGAYQDLVMLGMTAPEFWAAREQPALG